MYEKYSRREARIKKKKKKKGNEKVGRKKGAYASRLVVFGVITVIDGNDT